MSSAPPADDALDGLLLADREQLRIQHERIAARQARGARVGRERTRWQQQLAQARARFERRLASIPPVSYPPDLPVSGRIAEIREAIEKHQVVVICGETGSGKTTQLPKACLEAGRGLTGLIGHTQPRRIAARSVAARLAQELRVPLGGAVGFKVRFAETGSQDSLVRVMTDGIVLAEVRSDPDLLRYDTLIIDEAHERSLNIDFLLGYIRRLLPRRPDLRVLVTSATIDPDSYSRFFGGAPVIEVSGRGWPIETVYRPLGADLDDDLDPGLVPGIVEAVAELRGGGDVLVFLPGEREIRDTAEALQRAGGEALEILPLFSRLSWQEQQRVFEPGPRQRVVLATNVAETSITVPGIRAVVDSGLARIGRYSPRSKILRLPVEPVSQASADQRRGRCGRVGPGLCVRLYAEDDYAARERYTQPEILRTNLASVILQMEVLGLGAVDEFPFPDPPDTRLINDGYRLLQELEAVDGERRVTELGRQMARLPVDPQFARMLAEARRFDALEEILTLVAVLSIRDPRERPAEQRAAADERHAAFAETRSDFGSLLNLWDAWQGVKAAGSGSQARRWCRENFLSAARMREWEQLRSELGGLVGELGWKAQAGPAGYEAVHRSLLPGLLGNIGEKTEKGDYLGARGMRFLIAPDSALRSRAPKWVAAATMVETRRVYARAVAAIQPAWIETAAHHLVRRSYSEPEWLPDRGQVVARETVTLYGLTLAAGRRAGFGAIDPDAARLIFVREALLHGRSRLRAPFLRHNERVRAMLAEREARLRRRGVAVDEERIVAFYLGRIPARVNTVSALQAWLRRAGPDAAAALQFCEGDILPPDAPQVDPGEWPDSIRVGTIELPLRYRFEPAADDDGATLAVPLAALGQLDAGQLEWGIPAWRHELLTALIRGLPKPVRRLLVPAPDVAARCLAALGPVGQGSFYAAAAASLTREAGVPVEAGELSAIGLDRHLTLNLRVLDEQGRAVGQGRDLDALRRELRPAQRQSVEHSAADFTREGVQSWDFGRLPQRLERRTQGVALTLYPAIEDRGNAVALTCHEDQAHAESLTAAGIVRLLALRLEPQLRHVRAALAADSTLPLLLQPVGPLREFAGHVADRAVLRCCLRETDPLPRDADEFEAALERGRPELYDEAMRLGALATEALQQRRHALQVIDRLPEGLDAALVADCRAQVLELAGRGFIAAAPDPWLDALPRFLAAAAARVQRLRSAPRSGDDPQYEFLQWRATAAALCVETRQRHGRLLPAVTLLRWMVEEFGVSLFAQELRTSLKVSARRLNQQLAAARTAASA